MAIIDNEDIEKTKNEIKSAKKNSVRNIIIVQSKDQIYNRKLIEFGKIDYILFPTSTKSNFRKLKQIDFSINSIGIKLALKNKIGFIIDLEKIRKKNILNKAEEIEKLIYLVKTCKKKKANFKCINFKSEKDAMNLIISLGADTLFAKNAVKNVPITF